MSEPSRRDMAYACEEAARHYRRMANSHAAYGSGDDMRDADLTAYTLECAAKELRKEQPR